MNTALRLPLPRHVAAWRNKTLLYLVLILLLMVILLPLAWAVSTALKSPGRVFVYPPQAIPRPVQWHNFSDAWSEGQSFTIYFKNSLILTVFPVIGQILSCSLVAYGFARFRFPLRKVCFTLVLATLLIPSQVTLIPQFILFRHLNWINTFYPLIVPSFFATSAFSVFLLRQFFMTIPRELDEAALVDGSSYFRIFFQIMLPLSRTAVIAVGIIGFFTCWNDFLGPLIYLSSPEKYPLALGLNFFLTTYGGGVAHMELLMAASLITLALPLALFIVAQRYFVEGIAMTGIRG